MARFDEPRLSSEERRALTMLAPPGRNGAIRPLLTAHGFSASLIARLVSQGRATVTDEKVPVGDRMIDVAKVQITEAGREALRREVRLRPKD